MTQRAKLNESHGIISILCGLFLFLVPLSELNSQTGTLSREEFATSLVQAVNSGNQKLAESHIRENRLFVKPVVNDLLTSHIVNDLKGNQRLAQNYLTIAEKSAKIFEEIFGEKNLSIAVNYLTVWTKENKKTKLRADSLYSAGTALRSSEPDKTAVLYQKALELYRDIGDERGEAEVLGGLGLVYWNISDQEKCLSFYQEALDKRIKVDDKQLTGNTLNSMGSFCFEFLNDYPKALEWYEKAESIRSEIGDLANLNRTRGLKANTYYKIALEQSNSGYYSEALENFEKALEIYRSLKIFSPTDNYYGSNETLSQMGFIYVRLGDYNSAVSKLSEAVEMMEKEKDSVALAGVYNHFGVVLQKAGRIEKAQEYYLNSLRIYDNLNYLANELPVLGNLATIYFDKAEYSLAEEYCEKALNLSRELEEIDFEANILLNLANARVRLGKSDEALSDYLTCLRLEESLNNPDRKWRILTGMAENYKLRGEYEKSVQLNDSALTIIEEIRNNILDEDLKASYLASERYVFEDIINMLVSLHYKDKSKGYDRQAFRYAELCKSRVLLDLLSLPEKDLFYETSIASPEEIQALCPDSKTVFLEYAVGDSSTCLWVISRNGFEVFKMEGRKKIRESVEALRFALMDAGQKEAGFLVKTAGLMYGQLIEPAEKLLPKGGRLIILTDDILNCLPFEVLIRNSDKTQKDNFSNLSYLLKNYSVSYAQSASVLRNILLRSVQSKPLKSAEKRLIAFGDPDYGSSEYISLPYKEGLNLLPYSGEEISRIASYFPAGASDIYLGRSASEENLKNEKRLDQYSYIHFATHGFIDEEDPGSSALVLCRQEGSGEDGLVQAKEINNMRINADIAVLSACQTGLGKMIRGEGIIGLARSFMYAGTPSVLVSLWSVSDISTANLMDEFYRNLIRNRLDKTDALRKAQLTLIRDQNFSHPFFWAPFVLIGEWK